MSKVLVTLAEKVYKLPEEKVAELNEKSEEEIIEFFVSESAKRLQKAKTEGNDKGYSKAKTEVLSALETEIREEFDISDNSLKGLELVKHLATTIKEGAAADGGKELTDDAVKKHPIYKELEKSVDKQKKAVEKEWRDKLETVQKEYKQKETNNKVREIALAKLDEAEPILSEDAAKAQRVKEWWLKDLLSNNFEIDDDGNITMLDKEGNPMKDPQGNEIEFNDFLQGSITNSFEFKATQKRSAPGNGGKDGKDADDKTKKQKTKLPEAKTLDELATLMADQQYTVEERQTIHANYEKANGSK